MPASQISVAAYAATVNIQRIDPTAIRRNVDFGISANVSFVPGSVTCAQFTVCVLSNANKTVTITCIGVGSMSQTWDLSDGDTLAITINCL
ncbi:MAG: hypothetical protein ACKVHU_03585 [Acidimicrobiales bacterium]